MPSFDIVRASKPSRTFRVESVIGKFDLHDNNVTESFRGEINFPNEWSIGLIVGKSGTGKTTIAKELFPESYITNFEFKSESILDDMPLGCSVDDIVKTFNAVGFSSPPSWLKPYSVLSNGEKMRVDLARAILSDNDLFVFDEFTSVVDRQVAKIGSFAMQKAIRKTKKQFIAVTCHYDVVDWLLPDWIFNTDDMTFHSFEGQKKNRPELRFRIYETQEKNHYWKTFGRYHYLNHGHNNAARVFVCEINDDVCGFCSVLHLPHPRVKNIKNGHRLVILPDFQGIGLSHLFLKEVGRILKEEKNRFCFTTSNPAMIAYLKNSKEWRCTMIGRKQKHNGEMSLKGTGSFNRKTTSWEYV